MRVTGPFSRPKPHTRIIDRATVEADLLGEIRHFSRNATDSGADTDSRTAP
jgi:hypothetical protein